MHLYFYTFQQKSALSIAKEIAATDGFGGRGLNKGLTSTLGRHGVFNMVYFGFYHNVKGLVPQPKVGVRRGGGIMG